jgi:hypothetical protein
MTSKDRDLLQALLDEEQAAWDDFNAQVLALHREIVALPSWAWLRAWKGFRRIRDVQRMLLFPTQREVERLKRELIDLRAAERESRRTS